MDKHPTFTEKEVQDVADFTNFIYKHASWSVNTQEALTLSRYLVNMKNHISKMESFIMELKEQKEKPDRKKKGKN